MNGHIEMKSPAPSGPGRVIMARTLRHFGDLVTVLDRHGAFDCRGKIVGISYGGAERYDISTESGERLNAVPESRLRTVSDAAPSMSEAV